jgi:hypothetical protein
MEYHRREPRFDGDQTVAVTNLEQPGLPFLGRLVNFSANGTRMALDREVQPGTMVKVEWGSTILLGEIIYCSPQGEEFAVGLELEDVLYEREEMLDSMIQAWTTPAHGAR